MAREYRLTRLRRFVNWVMKGFLHIGLPPGGTYLLATRGRKTGRIHTTPVQIVQQDGARYLVAPYGEVNWVRNVRANPRVQLRKGRKVENLEVEAVEPKEAAPVLKQYLSIAPITRSYFEAAPGADVSEFEKEADRHPVFRLVEPDQGISPSSSSS